MEFSAKPKSKVADFPSPSNIHSHRLGPREKIVPIEANCGDLDRMRERFSWKFRGVNIGSNGRSWFRNFCHGNGEK